MTTTTLPVINLEEARFECIYGRGCEGMCCSNGRPAVTQEETERIEQVLPRVLPLLRPAARKLLEKEGFISRRRKLDHPMLRVVDGWCVFFHQGCVLHRIGAEEGDRLRYKPVLCALFPLEQGRAGEWYVRQKGFYDELWDLPCLDPRSTTRPAAISLSEEIALAARLSEQGSVGPYPAPQRKKLDIT